MRQSEYRVAAAGISFRFDADCGFIRDFVVEDQGHRISMMHKAPWVGSGPPFPLEAPPHLARLEGDFFCAPFSDASADSAPLHGWPANGQWQVSAGQDANRLKATLAQSVMGATVVKHLSVTRGQPFLYQRHVFTGGQGDIPAANHAMVSLPNGGHLRFSPKCRFETPGRAPESDPARGRSCLRYPARSTDPRHFPAASGGTVDLIRYPFGPAHEDFVIGIEAPESRLGWTAVTRPKEGDLYLSLRNPRRLPMTMLWHSNGGRDYPPWNSRHIDCLGVEEGVAFTLLAPTSPADQPSGEDRALVLRPEEITEVRHVTGCIRWPTGEPVRDIERTGDELTVSGEGGTIRTLAIDGGFLGL